MKLFFGSIIALVVVVIGFVIWVSFIPKSAPQPIVGVQEYTRTDRSHTTDKVTYSEIPPVGGNHAPVWAACNGKAYDKSIPNEQAVHSLEHGAVWITYQPTIGADVVAGLKAKLRNYTLLSPLPEQSSPVILTAWGKQLSLDSVNDPRVDQFVREFAQGPQTPEPGATCAPVSGGVQ